MEEINKKEEYELIRETIKTRPINRKKLFRRTVITAAMAVIFGVFACITFLVLEPVFSNMLSHNETPAPNEVSFPLDEEETKPADLLLEDRTETQPQIIIKETDRVTTEIEDYLGLYDEIYEVYRVCQKSIVTVAGVNKDVDLFNNAYKSQNLSTGLVVANNGVELLILTDSSILRNTESIEITFYDEMTSEGVVKEMDKNTGLAIVAVPLDKLSQPELDPSVIATLGNSKTNRLFASPVIAVGRPLGNVISIEKGMVTSKGEILNSIDNNYELFTTDMNGASSSNGFICNLSGEIVGVIYQKSKIFSQSTISAIGISDLKKTIERMSNAKPRASLGVVGTDVTAQAIANGVPSGAYVLEISMGSPAMKSGILGGDVITKIDGFDITSFTVYTEAVSSHEPGDEIVVTIERLNGDEYIEMEVSVVLGEQE